MFLYFVVVLRLLQPAELMFIAFFVQVLREHVATNQQSLFSYCKILLNLTKQLSPSFLVIFIQFIITYGADIALTLLYLKPHKNENEAFIGQSCKQALQSDFKKEVFPNPEFCTTNSKESRKSCWLRSYLFPSTRSLLNKRKVLENFDFIQ